MDVMCRRGNCDVTVHQVTGWMLCAVEGTVM